MNIEMQEVMDVIINSFRKNFFRHRQVTLYHDKVVTELEILQPKHLPRPKELTLSSHINTYELLHPAIECLYLSEQYQRKGFLNELVENLLNFEWAENVTVQGVFIQCVQNKELSRHLLFSEKWIPVIHSGTRLKLNKIIPLAREDKDFYSFIIDLFEGKYESIPNIDLNLIKNDFIERVQGRSPLVAGLSDDQLCGFAKEPKTSKFFEIPDEHYNEYKRSISKLAKQQGESPHAYIGKSSLIDTFFTTKELRN
ncbi:TPA: hypothetical protein NJZ47_005116 [Vibrio parahaemolyticus]|nr:hypothetical protein [Vibrio parahaemolyticus]HCG5287102.1 hypothetical protein [Vibrio parahaemolyticus]